MSSIIPALPGATPLPTITPEIIKTISNVSEVVYVRPFTMDLTAFILSTIFMLLFVSYIMLALFGKPVIISSNAGRAGKSLIFHFNTPKTAEIKDAHISGEAFRYSDVRDGTVSASPDSVMAISGKSLVWTFAQFGITIPIKILAAISILVNDNINNIQELKGKHTGGTVVLSGYDFYHFPTLLQQNKESALVPLKIEAVPNFTDENIVADYTESELMIRGMIDGDVFPKTSSTGQLILIVIIIILLVLVSTVIK